MRFRAFLWSVAVALTVAAALWPVLGGEYVYDQFVVGAISLQADNKSVDYHALLMVFAVFLVLTFAFRGFARRVGDIPGIEASIGHLLGLTLLPLTLWLGTALVRNAAPDFPYAWALAAGTLMLFAGWRWRTSMGIDADAFADLGELVLCSVLLAFFAGLGVSLLLVHASSHTWPASPDEARALVAAVVVGNVLVVGLLFVRASIRANLERAMQRWLMMLQFALPLLGLVLLPPQLIHRGGLEPYVWPWTLLLALALYAAFAWARLATRLRRSPAPGPSLPAVLEPLALAMIAIFLTAGQSTFELLSAPGYPTFFGDDFHLGEQILPWQQLIDFHKIPYVDFAPVHGLMPLLTGALNEFFFDGTLANLNASFSILVAIASAITVFLACRVSGVVLGLVLCFLLAPFDRLLFLAPVLLLLADAKLLARPAVWFGTWCLATIFMLGYNAAIGSAFAGGTAPFAILALFRAYKAGPTAWRTLVVLGIVGAALVVVTPHVRAILGGFFTFLIDNGTTNTVGHGVPLARGFGFAGTPSNGVLASRVLFDLFRLSWILVALFALQRGLADWRAVRSGGSTQGASLLSLATGLTLLLLAAWSMGRIDVELPSRPGAVSFLAVGTLLPILYVTHNGFPPYWVRATFALIIAIFAGMHGLQDRFSVAQLALRGFPRSEVPANLQRITGSEFGNSRLGTLFATPERRGEIASFEDALTHVLAPGETYFDLTNRQALYFYLNLPVPALYSANFNALNENQQRRMLRQLTADAPAAVLISPAMEGDGITASLRSFFLYKHFVRSYRPIAYGPYTFLVNARSPAFPREPDAAQEEVLLDRAFAHPNLHMLPAGWGASWTTLKRKARFVADLVPATSDLPTTDNCSAADDKDARFELLRRYQLPPTGRAEPADLLEIRLRPGATMPASLRLSYSSATSGALHTITMQVRGSTLIVPVSSYPSWLRTPDIHSINLCALAGEASAKDVIANVSAWTITDPLR